MPEFTFSIETPEGATADEDAWARVEAAMRANPNVSGAATVFHHDSGVISSRFQVEAATLERAQKVAIDAFKEALVDAGLPPDWRILAP